MQAPPPSVPALYSAIAVPNFALRTHGLAIAQFSFAFFSAMYGRHPRHTDHELKS